MKQNENELAHEIEEFLKRSGAILKKRYMMKAGCMYLKPKEGYIFFPHKSERPGYKFCNELFRCLTKSQYVMETSPQNDVKGFGEYDIPMYGSLEHDISALLSFINIRFTVPERRRRELFGSSEDYDWRPEQFYMLFNGNVFYAISEIDKYARHPDMGQVARESLKSAMETSELWETIIVAPTPLHINFYILFISPDKGREKFEAEVPTIMKFEDNLIFFQLASEDDKAQINLIADNMLYMIEAYYEDMISRKKLVNKIREFRMEDTELNTLLEKNYRLSAIRKLFDSKLSTNIRKTLSKMYQILVEISNIEIEIEDMDKRVFSMLEKTPLVQMRSYFERFLGKDQLFDKNAYLTTMNFAAEESSNMAMIQATLYAALIGGVIGSLVTFLVQYLVR